MPRTCESSFTQKSELLQKIGEWFRFSWLTIVATVGFFGLWEIVIRVFDIPLYILPPPSLVGEELGSHIRLILHHSSVTGSEAFVGFIVAAAIGVPLSMVVAFSPLLMKTLYPVAVAAEMVPKIAFAPLFVIWFGFGFLSKIVVVLLVCVFPILINGIFGFTSLGTEYVHFIQSTGSRTVRAFWKIRLPAALPQLFIGLKGAAVNAAVGATIAEWIGGNAGLGYYIQTATGEYKMDLAIASIIMLTIVGLALYGVVLYAEKRLIPWHVSQRAPIAGARGVSS
jgi:NitT/TauT family transport system permease protein